MLNYVIPLLASYLPMFSYILWAAFALVFIASIPELIRRITSFV